MDISFIVAFDNNKSLLENFIDATLPFIEGREDRELVLAADGCKDIDTVEFARQCAERYPNIKLIELPKMGYSRANNAGVEASSGKYLLFANTDIFPEPDAVDRLRSKFDGAENLGAAQGCLLYPQSGKIMCCGHVFNDYQNHHLFQGRKPSPFTQQDGKRQAINSAFMMMPRTVYDEMGGMTEFYYNAYDGMELTLRVGLAGYDVMYFGDVFAWHSTGGSRDYIKHNNEYQSKYFYTHFGDKIRTDLGDYLSAGRDGFAPPADEYDVIDCTFCMTWRELLDGLGYKIGDVMEIPNRDSSSVDLYRNVSPDVRNSDKPIIFIVNNFNDVTGNRRWFSQRGKKGDLIIDFFGNIFEVDGDVLALTDEFKAY